MDYLELDAEISTLIDGMSRKLLYINNLLMIKGPGIRTVTRIIAEFGDITRFTNVKPIQKPSVLALVEDSSGKHEGKTQATSSA